MCLYLVLYGLRDDDHTWPRVSIIYILWNKMAFPYNGQGDIC